MCVCAYAVKLFSGPSLAFLGVIIWAKQGLLSGPRSFLAYFYSGIKRFLHIQLSFCVFLALLPGNFVKIAVFENSVPKLFFSFQIFRVFSFLFKKAFYLTLLDTIKVWFWPIFVFSWFKEKKKQKKTIDFWNFGFCVFVQKRLFRDNQLVLFFLVC